MSTNAPNHPDPPRGWRTSERQTITAVARRQWRAVILGGVSCSLTMASIAMAARLAETRSAKLMKEGDLAQTPPQALRAGTFGVIAVVDDQAAAQPSVTGSRRAGASIQPATPPFVDTAAGWHVAPAALEQKASSTELYELRIRQEVLQQLRAFGIAQLVDKRVLSDIQLDNVTAGQATAGVAPGGDPGKDSVDPELSALNRVLVEKGGLLLRPWSVELQPEISYSYKGSNGLLVVDSNGRRTAVAHDVDLNKVETALIGRLGLPWRSQAEVKVPYAYAQEDSSSGVQTDSRSQSGLGDVEVALTHQFLRESVWLPDLLVEGRWKTDTGKDAFDGDNGTLPLGTGFNGLGARVTAVKTVDPVVLVGTVGHTRNFEGKRQGFDIDPGDQWLGSLGSVLAAGPGVSLRTGISVGFSDEATVDGDRVAGSDRVDARLNFGVGATVNESSLLDLGFGVGVTDDAPDFTIRTSLAYRF